MKKQISIFLILLLVLTVAGCGKGENDTNNKRDKNTLSIYTTVYPLQYFTERIGGKHVNVSTIYPPGADEHSFEPTQRDMIALADSDLFIYIGLGLEGFVDKAKTSLKGEDVTMIAAAGNIDIKDGGHHDGHGDVDPHIWLDPVYAKDLALAIKDALSKKQPKFKADFEKNYQELAAELEGLDRKFSETAAGAGKKEIIVSHAAFGYWESRYGIKQVPLAGISTASEPTQKEMEKIITTIKNDDIGYILVEQNINSKLAKTVQDETGARFLPVHNLATLTGKNIKAKETYFTLMEKNLKTLKKAME